MDKRLETELDYYHQKLYVRVDLRVSKRPWTDITKCQENL